MLFRWQLLSIPTYTKSLEPFTSHDLTRKSHRASLDLHTFLAKHCVTSSIWEYIPRELAQVCLHSLFDVSNSRFYSLFWCDPRSWLRPRRAAILSIFRCVSMAPLDTREWPLPLSLENHHVQGVMEVNMVIFQLAMFDCLLDQDSG
jgi:hypothetical protein